MLSTRFDEAFVFAHDLHRRQKRKGTEIPYLAHLMSVAALVVEHGGQENDAIAALLHDAAEDQGGAAILMQIRERFGNYVADIVADCTDSWSCPKPPWRERKEEYIAALPKKPRQSLLVSLADKTHNAEAILSDFQSIGDALWQRFAGGRSGTLWYYQSLLHAFETILHQDNSARPLTKRLARAVGQLPPR